MFHGSNGRRRRAKGRLPVHVYALYLFVITFVLTGVTFSKYVTSSSGQVVTQVRGLGDLELAEKTRAGETVQAQSYTVAPGVDLYKNPVVSFGSTHANQLDAYVFLEVITDGWEYSTPGQFTVYWEEGTQKEPLLQWSVEPAWRHLSHGIQDGKTHAVYYLDPETTKSGQKIQEAGVILNDAITVSETVPYAVFEQMRIAVGAGRYEIGFQAYAVQKQGFASIEEAWASVSAKS